MSCGIERFRNAGLFLDDVRIEGLVPEALRRVSAPEALERIDMIDGEMHARLEASRAEGQVLRFGATLSSRGAEVGLRSYWPEHPFAAARGTDNVARITTARYRERPLVVQGPGAGPELTTGGSSPS